MSSPVSDGALRVHPPIVDSETREFRSKFNRQAFQFGHSLANHPLFDLRRLMRIGEEILSRGNPDHLIHSTGTGGPDTGLDRQPRERLAEAIARVETTPGTWIKLTRVQDVSPEFQQLLAHILKELEERSGVPIAAEMSWVSPTIFIASPGTVTPYHIDHEVNFLFQIRGEKEVNLFDPMDRSILTEEEIERFYVGVLNAARYREENQSKAAVYRLKPGMAVHHPSIAPHWVKNGDSVTVALSVGFGMRAVDTRTRVYQLNHYVRKLGLEPSPLGRAPWKDAAKIAALGLLSTRHPKTDRDAYASGIDRARIPARALKGLVGRFLR
jgi:hypothetical protein